MRNKNKVKTIRIRRKVIGSLLILLSAALISSFVLAVSSLVSDSRQRNDEVRTMLDNYIEYSNSTIDMMINSYNIGVQNLTKSTELNASVIKRTEEEWSSGSPDSDVRLYKDGCIFLYDGRNVQLPVGLPAKMNTQVIHPEGDNGIITDYDPEKDTGGEYTCAYTRIKDDLYYMEWAHFDEPEGAAGDVDWDALLESIADTHGMSVIEFQKEETGELSIVGGSERFASYDKAEDLGLSSKTIEASMHGKNQLSFVRHNSYYVQSKPRLKDNDESIPEEEKAAYPDTIVTALVPSDVVFENFGSSYLAFALIMIIFGIVLIAWIVMVYRLASGGPSDVTENEKIKPSEMKKKVIIYILASTLTIGCCCAFSHALNNLFKESNHASTALENISNSIRDAGEGSDSVWEESKKEYIDEAQKIAAILDENPQLRTPEWLKEASGIIGAEYIMLYDTNGDELLTDSRYRGLTLGNDESSATYDFRRLLKGVRNISHEKLTDEVTGLTLDMYGVSLKYVGREKDAYGALIIAVDPKSRTAAEMSEKLSDINTLLTAHSAGNYLSFAVDPKTGKIVYSSNDGLIDRDAVSAGLNESMVKGSFIGFFDLDSISRFGRSSDQDGLLYYYSAKRDRMFAGTGSFAQTCMILNLIILSLVAYVLLHGYKAVYDKMMSGGAGAAAETDEQTERHVRHASGRAKVFNALGITGGPFRKAMMILMILGAVALTVMLLVALNDGGSSGTDSVIRYILNGDWDRGINIFAMTASFLIMCNAVLIIAILYAVRVVLSSVLNARATTICSLITSVLQYLAIIIAIFIALGYCGVDYKALLASVGIMSMAVSFGARDFVSDIFAGINLLTNNAYQMGDIVEINGYRGTVREVNLRTTKLAGSGGNVKTIRNSTIGDVVNLSANNSVYTAELIVSIDNELTKIEEMLNKELPEIAEKYPQFLKGPVFKGVGSMGGGKETLLIQTECNQKDYSFVVSAVNRELQLLFKNNGIAIL